MNVLVLGGTQFAGRRFVEYAARHRHIQLTLLNRGKTNPDLFTGGAFSNVESVHGDRNHESNLEPLKGRSWDVVIDFSCFFPRQLELIVDAVVQKATRYILLSSVSALESLIRENPAAKPNDDSPVLECTSKQAVDSSNASYGKRKAECERIVNRIVDHCVVRPALIVGPYDPTDRFYYWLYRVAKCGKILIPEKGENPVALTFVDDLVAVLYHLLDCSIDSKDQRKINVISCSSLTINEVVETASHVLNKSPDQVLVKGDVLTDAALTPWIDIPLWISNKYADVGCKNFDKMPTRRTAFQDICKICVEYYERLGWPEPTYGIPLEFEREILEKHAR